jgi:type 1 glutamine amidotransferase
MTLFFKNTVSVLLALFVTMSLLAQNQNNEKNVLIYTKNGEGYVHKNIPHSVEALKKLCVENGIKYEVTEDPSWFTEENLANCDALIFSNTNNEAFETDAQKIAFQRYIQAGGSWVGIHSSCASEREWPWFWSMVGGLFARHPPFQEFDIKIIDHNHPSTAFFGDVWKWEDECYYVDHFNPDIRVLLAADLRTVEDKEKDKYPGKTFGNYIPIAWYHEFDGGRQWFTAVGHDPKHYSDPTMLKHIWGGIQWALEGPPLDYSNATKELIFEY